jgi:hypothetical protein
MSQYRTNVEIDLVEQARKLDDVDFNKLIVSLFRITNDDYKILLMKQMFDSMYDIDQEELLDYLNSIK